MTQLTGILYGLLKNRGQRPIGLAKALGTDKGTISRWNEKGVPHTRLQDVESKTGIAACDLRPDLAHLFVKAKAQ